MVFYLTGQKKAVQVHIMRWKEAWVGKAQFNQTQCNSDIACEWFEDIDSYNCSNFSSESQCNQYSQYGCSWEWSWGGWMNHGSTCAGGYFQVDNGFWVFWGRFIAFGGVMNLHI